MLKVLAVCGTGAAVVVGLGYVNIGLGIIAMFPVYEFCDRLLSGE